MRYCVHVTFVNCKVTIIKIILVVLKTVQLLVYFALAKIVLLQGDFI